MESLDTEHGKKTLTKFQKIFLFVCLFAAFLIRLNAVLQDISLPVKDAAEYDQLARGLVEGKGYRDAQGNLTAWRPPFYPIFLAAIYQVAGHNYQAVRLAQALLSMLTVWLIAEWARILFGGRAACWAALTAAVYPAFYAYTFSCSELLSETLYTFLLTASLVSLYQYLYAPHWLKAVTSGLALGFAILTRPIPLLLVFFLPVIFLLLRYPWRKVLPPYLLLCGVTFLVLLPWTIRNYRVFGRLVPVSTMSGATFYLANHPGADGMGGSGGGPTGFYHGVFFPIEEKLVAAGVPETERTSVFYQKGLEFIRSRPQEILRLFLWKALLYMDPRTLMLKEGKYQSTVTWFYLWVLAGAVASGFVARSEPELRRPILSMALIFGYFVAVHMVYLTSERYRFPTEPLLIVLASFSFDRLTRRVLPLPAMVEKGNR